MLLDMAGLHQLAEAVGIVKVADPAVALAQLAQGLRVHHAGQTAENEEDEYLDIQLLMDKTETLHISLLKNA